MKPLILVVLTLGSSALADWDGGCLTMDPHGEPGDNTLITCAERDRIKSEDNCVLEDPGGSLQRVPCQCLAVEGNVCRWQASLTYRLYIPKKRPTKKVGK